MIGLVLIGGESSRMGKPKFLLEYENGEAIYKTVYRLLETCCNEVYVSCNVGQVELVDEDYPLLVDHEEKIGPMASFSAFMELFDDDLFVLPCDTPRISDAEIRRIIENSFGKEEVILARNEEKKQFEPLIGIYKKGGLRKIKKMKSSRRAIKYYIDFLTSKEVVLPGESTQNINSKGDFLMYKKKFQN